MDDLISRSALLAEIEETKNATETPLACILATLDMCVKKIEEASAVEVVRCKDCRWRNTKCCPYMQLVPESFREDDDFCSDGEKREEGAALTFNLKPRRVNAGLTREDMAIILGVPRRTVSMWESGKCEPAATMLLRIAVLLGCRISDLYESEAAADGPDV